MVLNSFGSLTYFFCNMFSLTLFFFFFFLVGKGWRVGLEWLCLGSKNCILLFLWSVNYDVHLFRWGQVFILDALSKYKAADAREAESIVERVTPRLQHANCAVVLSAVKVIFIPLFNL